MDLPSNVIQNKLFIGVAGIPSVATKVNGRKVWNNTIDFGFNGGIIIPFTEFEKQRKKGKIGEYVKSKSLGVIGIYGQQNHIRETYLSRIETMSFGDAVIKNKIVTSEKYLQNTLGLDFFRDYRVILNWDSKKIKLISQKPSSELGYRSFGFDYSYENNGLHISKIFDNTKSAAYLEIGDKILSINNEDYSYISDEGYCVIVDNGVVGKAKELDIKILRNNEELNFKFKREKLL